MHGLLAHASHAGLRMLADPRLSSVLVALVGAFVVRAARRDRPAFAAAAGVTAGWAAMFWTGHLVPVDAAAVAPFAAWLLAPRLARLSPAGASLLAATACIAVAWGAAGLWAHR